MFGSYQSCDSGRWYISYRAGNTGDEIVKDTEVKQQLNGLLRYVDLNKMVTTFLTPDILNKLGVLRGG